MFSSILMSWFFIIFSNMSMTFRDTSLSIRFSPLSLHLAGLNSQSPRVCRRKRAREDMVGWRSTLKYRIRYSGESGAPMVYTFADKCSAKHFSASSDPLGIPSDGYFSSRTRAMAKKTITLDYELCVNGNGTQQTLTLKAQAETISIY